MDSSTVAASGALAATVGMMAQRSAGRRLRRRLRQERARNRVELHDLEIRLEQATRHLAEAVALAEAATRAMSGAPLVMTPEGAVVARTAVAPTAVVRPEPFVRPAQPAQPAAGPASQPVLQPEPVSAHVRPYVAHLADADTEILEAVPAAAAAVRPVHALQPVQAAVPVQVAEPARHVQAPAVAERLRAAARVDAEVAFRATARSAVQPNVFGSPVVPATPAELFTPADGVPAVGGDDAGWFAPARRPGLPPAPLSPAVGLTLPTAGWPASGDSRPPEQREPTSGPIPLVPADALGGGRLPARLAEAKVVDLSLLAHPARTGLIVVRHGGRQPVATDSVA